MSGWVDSVRTSFTYPLDPRIAILFLRSRPPILLFFSLLLLVFSRAFNRLTANEEFVALVGEGEREL